MGSGEGEGNKRMGIKNFKMGQEAAMSSDAIDKFVRRVQEGRVPNLITEQQWRARQEQMGLEQSINKKCQRILPITPWQ